MGGGDDIGCQFCMLERGGLEVTVGLWDERRKGDGDENGGY